MAEFIGGIFASIFGTHSALATIIISMFPIIELKGAIPIGMSVDYWGSYALSGMESFLFSLIGSSIVVPIIALVFTPILNWLKKTKLFKSIGNFIDEKVTKHSQKLEGDIKKSKSKSKAIIKWLGIFAFVAVPLPLTGVWTGTCVAVVIGLKFWQTCLSVILGNIVAGLIIMFVCSIFPEIITILSIIFLAIVLCMLIWVIVQIILNSRKKKIENKEIETVSEENQE